MCTHDSLDVTQIMQADAVAATQDNPQIMDCSTMHKLNRYTHAQQLAASSCAEATSAAKAAQVPTLLDSVHQLAGAVVLKIYTCLLDAPQPPHIYTYSGNTLGKSKLPVKICHAAPRMFLQLPGQVVTSKVCHDNSMDHLLEYVTPGDTHQPTETPAA